MILHSMPPTRCSGWQCFQCRNTVLLQNVLHTSKIKFKLDQKHKMQLKRLKKKRNRKRLLRCGFVSIVVRETIYWKNRELETSCTQNKKLVKPALRNASKEAPGIWQRVKEWFKNKATTKKNNLKKKDWKTKIEKEKREKGR